MDKKVSHPASSLRPMTAPKEAVAVAAKAPTVGVDTEGQHLKLPDTMTKIPKLAHGSMPSVGAAHKHNSNMHAQRFGTDTEKAKVKSDAGSNYGGCDGGDCPTY